MVVNGLDEYITVKCKQCVKTVPICAKPGTSYVIDGCSFVSHIIRQTSWVFGGQWKEIKDAVEKFVISLLGEGCDAVFVMPHWADVLTATDLKNIKTGLDFVSVNQRLPTSIDFYQNPPCVYYMVAHILKACRVEVICSVSDFEFEVAGWAKLKNCTGIISNNNEFIALKGVPYFRLNTLDTQKHTIDCIDRFLLTKNLGLKETHLPLLSCLLSNSLIPLGMLQAFHRKLQSGMQMSGHNPVLDIMPRICMYVRPQTTQYNMLARTALADETKAEFLQAIISRYTLSSVDETWKPYQPPDENRVTYNSVQIYEDAVTKQINCECIPFTHGILTGYLYEQGVTLEHEPLTSSFDLYRPLRKSCYSIILGGDASVTEKCIASALSVETVACEEFAIKEKTVKLQNLLNSKRKTLGWSTFVNCAKVTFNQTLARQLPAQYLGLCCILNYWWHSPLIHLAQWELNALLAQAVSQYAADVASLRRILVSVVNTRAINLALLLARGAEALLQIASVTSLPPEPFLLHNYFDGKLFSFYYYLSDKGDSIEKLCDDMPDRIEMFKFLMMVVQSESLSIDDEEESEEDEEEEPKKNEGNVSIVPEYEAISDDEDDNVEIEPVTDEDELFDNAIAASKDTASSSKPEVDYTGMTPEKLANLITESNASGDNGLSKENKEDTKNRGRLDRKDSTGGAVQDMMRLQMTSPDVVTRLKFSSFPGISGISETDNNPSEPVKKQNSTDSNTTQLFPINSNGTAKPGTEAANRQHFRSNKEYGAWHEPAPPGLENFLPTGSTADKIIGATEDRKAADFDFKPRIPLPPLPGSLLDKVGDNDMPPPMRCKRHSDKENYGMNEGGRGGRPSMYSVVAPEVAFASTTEHHVKRHKSEES